MAATDWYVQNIKDYSEHDLEVRIRMMKENGFVEVRRYKEFSNMMGRTKYHAVMRRDLNAK